MKQIAENEREKQQKMWKEGGIPGNKSTPNPTNQEYKMCILIFCRIVAN